MIDFDLAERLEEVARQSNGGAEAGRALRDWTQENLPFVDTAEVLRFTESAPVDLIVDSFRITLPFGTGGRRGHVGIGPNRINLRTLALTVAGHSEYLRKVSGQEHLKVVIANDTRVFSDITATHKFMGGRWSLLGTSSRSLALLACQIYAVYGIETYMTRPEDPNAYMPTPELSFAIREMGAAGGLNVSASHNHPDDNGLKVFTPTGGQYCPPDDEDLAHTVENVELPPDLQIQVSGYGQVAQPIPEHVHAKYIDLYVRRDLKLCAGSADLRAEVPIVYTPLCGTGLASVGEVLDRAGYRFQVPQDQLPDGSFAAIPMRSPNPEIPGVAAPAMEYASTLGAKLVLSTDPDADRLGVEVQLANDEWKHLTGNQIAAILAYFLLADEDGPELPGSIVTTVATSKSLAAIGMLGSGVSVTDNLMIGFKFIGQLLDSEEKANPTRESRLVLAAEESHGYLTTASLRDKDAASAAYMVAHLHVRMSSIGSSLWDYLMQVYERIGLHVEFGRSLVLPGAQGADTINALMKSLREEPIQNLGGEHVITRNDFIQSVGSEAASVGERASRNVLEIITEHYRVVIRPSGTEAKLKYYFEYHEPPVDKSVVPGRYASLERTVWTASSELYANIAHRAGYTLSPAALRLPDIIPLQEKVAQV